MSDSVSHPTLYPEVNVVLSLLLSQVQTTLGDRFIGLYLGGSLALGDFDLRDLGKGGNVNSLVRVSGFASLA